MRWAGKRVEFESTRATQLGRSRHRSDPFRYPAIDRHRGQRVWVADAKLKNVALRSPRHSQKLTAYHAVEPARGHQGTGKSVSR
jgi:hypothetical protein